MFLLGTGSWILLIFSIFFFNYSVGLETNRTIDDKFGDSVTGQRPIFLPTTTGIWDGETCTGCRFQPDKAVAFKGTWQAATFRPEVPGGSGPLSIDLSFEGTAIYIFFITGNQIAGGIITTLMECNFTLDGVHADFFQHIPDKSQDFQYNVLAFNRTGLRNTNHSVKITTEGVDYHLLLNFDYAIYTFDDTPDQTPTPSISPNTLPPAQISPTTSSPPAPLSSSESEHTPPLGGIIGGTLGGLAAVLGVIVVLYICRDRRSHREAPELPLHVDTTARHANVSSTEEAPRGGKSLSRIFLPISPRNRDRKSLRQSINPAGFQPQPQPSTHSSSLNSTVAGDSTISMDQSDSSVSVDAARRARRAQLENQLRAAEQELREMGVEPRRGPPGPNVPPAMLQTSVYIEYRRLQGEMEEPPPQYSE